MISGPLITVMCAPTSLAMARPIMVFPVPGGPYSRTPRGGGIPAEREVRALFFRIKSISHYSIMGSQGYLESNVQLLYRSWRTAQGVSEEAQLSL